MVTRKMQMLAASLALVLCVSLYSVPRAKAMGLEVATGNLAVATYLSATGAPLVVTPGASANLVATGISSMASSYVGATGVASSGSAWLSSLAAGVSISPAGMIVLSAAAVIAIGALVAWYIDENSLFSSGDSALVFESSDYSILLSDGTYFPLSYRDSSGNVSIKNKLLLSSFTSSPSVYFKTATGVSASYFVSSPLYRWTYTASDGTYKSASDSISDVSALGAVAVSFGFVSDDSSKYYHFYLDSNDNVVATYHNIDRSFLSQMVTESTKLSVQRDLEFTQPDTEFESESQKQMVIDAGFAPGTTLDAAVEQVPDLIVAGDFAPTYEITTVGTGEGTDTETPSDEETGIYIPILSDIKTALSNLSTSIVDGVISGLKSLVVPDEAFFAEAVPALQETFQGRMGLLTFPISLLADFLGRLLDLSDQEPILRWDSVRIYGTELIAAGHYNLNDSLASARVKQMHDIYMVVVNSILIFAFLGLCQNKYRKIMQN